MSDLIALTFDVFSLQGNGVYTTDTDIFSAPELDVREEKLADADGAVIVKTSFKPKVFTCEGYMTAGSYAELGTLIDSFKQNLNKQNQNFDIDYAGSTRRYVATPKNMIISVPKGLNSATWSVQFECPNPVGADIDQSTLLATTTVTSSSAVTAMTVEGSYRAEPLITVSVTSVTGGTPSKSITISNDSTLRGVTVTRNWAAGDVMEIDCLNKTIYVNNAVVEFTGQFPKWEPGNSGISYLDDFSTRSVDVSATYYRRYL